MSNSSCKLDLQQHAGLLHTFIEFANQPSTSIFTAVWNECSHLSVVHPFNLPNVHTYRSCCIFMRFDLVLEFHELLQWCENDLESGSIITRMLSMLTRSVEMDIINLIVIPALDISICCWHQSIVCINLLYGDVCAMMSAHNNSRSVIGNRDREPW